MLTHAMVFCCPSVYEPLGIVNLEAMACETAVVASRVGGIPEVVVDGETGLLVDLDPGRPAPTSSGASPRRSTRSPADPAGRAAMGQAGRRGRSAEFGWDAVAARTVELYRSLR